MDGVVLVGNPPFLPTGYGKQLKMIGQYLMKRYKVLHISDYGYDLSQFDFDGVTVAPVCEKKADRENGLSNTYIQETVNTWLSRNSIDRWVMIALGDLHKWGDLFHEFPSAVIAPIDRDTLTEREVETLRQSIPVAMSIYGQKTIEENGLVSAFYLPHVCEPATISKSKIAIRSTRHWEINPGCFTVGFWGDFSKRKSPQRILQAWSEFSMGKSNVKLWIHHSNHPQMEKPNEAAWFEAHITDTSCGWTDKDLNTNLKGLDALLHCSNQEGFGVLQIEAQMQGVPVINTDYGPMPELNFRKEMVVGVDGYREGNDYGLPSVAGIVVRLQALFEEWEQQINSGANLNPVEEYLPDRVFPQYLDGLLNYMFKHYYPPLTKIRPKKASHIGLVSTYGINCGIATYTQMLAESLKDLGHQVTIFAECVQGTHPIGTRESNPVVDIEYCWNRNYQSGGALAHAIESVNPDVIHVQHEATMLRRFSDLYSTLRSMDRHIVSTLHTPDFNNETVKEAILLSDAVFLHNENLAVELAGTVPAPVDYIPHGALHIAPMPESRKEIGLPDGIPLLFHYGFPSKSKGTLTLLKAIQKAKESTQYFEVAIFAGENAAGLNDYTKECEDLAEQMDGVYYSKEFISEHKLNQFLNASNILVFPYSGNGVNSTSGALMRTLSAGKPIIATDEGRLRDLIGGVHGWKCATDNVEALAMCIKESIRVFSTQKAQYKRMSENVLRLASERDWTIIAGLHSNAYQKICAAWGFHHHSCLSPNPNGNAPLLCKQEKPSSNDQEE